MTWCCILQEEGESLMASMLGALRSLDLEDEVGDDKVRMMMIIIIITTIMIIFFFFFFFFFIML
jgi:hypothetical protein